MPLFQSSVLKKYLQDLDEIQVQQAFSKFVEKFGDKNKQDNIRNAKEEQYQEGFLRELFCAVLGYTINPENNFNLTTEYKNEKDAKKADGAILKDNKPVAIIELKGTDTIDLDTVEQQAFNYKNNQSACKYVIISNFAKLRFYIENAIDFEEFDLFNLTQDKFELLYLCLAEECLLNDIPLAIKQASVAQEENITKKLYNDYSAFKRVLFSNIVGLNPIYDKLLVYKKTQKLLDRLLFIFFAEDRLLLPPNSIREILKQWETLKELDSYTPLYDRLKKYFGYLLTGHKGKQYEIFAYNGGLFEPDDVLDNITIDDTLLFAHLTRLADYNYETEVDVNILGHIFEHSLSEIEQIQAELEGKETDKSETKRKKDGIYYTPKYITKYIVENTIGTLCNEKKNEFGINEDEFGYAKRKEKRKELVEKLDAYRNWLLKLTICDPACGSGAFLVQSLNFLIDEHKLIDELQARVLDSSIVFPNIENTILENNLYGVDLNDESVEIAKLSLWLRTAQKGRKLTSLNNNIKCGNSLIDDPAIAGDKAFNWQKEFSEVFANGGFDVIIGNPPYVRAENIIKTHREYFISEKSKYSKTFGRFDLYILFNEMAISLLKNNGFLSFIFPSSFFNQNYSVLQREWLLNDLDLLEIVDLSEIDVFKGVSVETGIIRVRKTVPSAKVLISKPKNEVQFISNHNYLINKDIFRSLPNITFRADLNCTLVDLIYKISNQSKLLSEFCYIVIGAVPHNSETGATKDRLIKDVKESNSCKKYIEGKNVNRYIINWSNRFIDYQPEEMHRPKFPELFENEKILVRNISTKEGLMATYDNNSFYVNDTMSVLIQWYKLINVNQRGVCGTNIQIDSSKEISLLFLLALINSHLVNFYFKLILSSNLHVYPEAIRNLPIKIVSIEQQQPFIESVGIMLSKNKELQDLKTRFTKLLSSKYTELNINKKLADWTELDFKAFVKELEKQNIKLSLPEQAEWLDYFEKEKAKAQEIKAVIDKTDKEIDSMVYQLYGLTDEEIGIVEGS